MNGALPEDDDMAGRLLWMGTILVGVGFVVVAGFLLGILMALWVG